MPQSLRSDSPEFISGSTAQETKPIWLYEITIPGESILYYTNRRSVVLYPEGDATEKTYLPRPIEHEDIGENLELQAETVSVILGNTDREMQAFLEAHDGMVDASVLIKVVHQDNLAVPNSHISQTLIIDHTIYDTGARNATLVLSSKLDLGNLRIPLRSYNRDYCPWAYTELGCYEDDGAGNPVQPDLFFTDEGYPVFPDPAQSIDDWDDDGFLDVITSGLNCIALERNPDQNFVCELYPDPVSNLNANSFIFIGNDPSDLTNGWKFSDLTSLGLNNAQWNSISIPLDTFTEEGTGLDITTVSFVRVFSDQTGWTDFKVKEVFLEVTAAAESPFFNEGNPDTCSNVFHDCARHGAGAIRQFGGFRYLPREGTAYYV